MHKISDNEELQNFRLTRERELELIINIYSLLLKAYREQRIATLLERDDE
jgi:hypothetical protein